MRYCIEIVRNTRKNLLHFTLRKQLRMQTYAPEIYYFYTTYRI
jgi:hypothetical protein